MNSKTQDTMKIKDIHAKVLKGETLTDEEKKFLEEYDHDAVTAAARRDAEKAAAAAKKAEKDAMDRLKEAEDKLKEGEDAKQTAAKGESEAVAALKKTVAELQKKSEAAEKKVAAQERSAAIGGRAKALGIVPVKGVSDAVFAKMVEDAVGGTDITDTTTLDAVLNGFKTDNPGLIASNVKDGSGHQGGNPGVGGYTGPNPHSKKYTKPDKLDLQIKIDNENPELSKKLQAEAAAEA